MKVHVLIGTVKVTSEPVPISQAITKVKYLRDKGRREGTRKYIGLAVVK